MFNQKDHSYERKHRICERISSFAQRNRRPIADTIEAKLARLTDTIQIEDAEDAMRQALKTQDGQIFNALFAFSRFQVS